MRIGIDARFYGTVGKGLGRYTAKLITHLEKLDTKNEYFIFLRRENFEEYVPRNPRFQKVMAHYPWYGLSEQLVFPLCLLRARLDLVHFPHFNVPLGYPKRFVVTIHDLILLRYPTRRNTTRSAGLYAFKYLAYRLIIASAMRRAAHIITVSEFTKRDVCKRVPAACRKISVTYEAADSVCQFLMPAEESTLFRHYGLMTTEDESETLRITRDILKPYLLYVGNAYPHKNLEAIVRAAPRFPAYTFVLVGREDDFYARLKRMASRLQVPNLLFAGYVDDRWLNTLYRFATGYLFPSFYEGFGLPPLEAMARGVPVLASDQGSLPEILGEAASYFNPHVSRALDQALERFLSASELRKELVRRGYRQAARYDWQRLAQETLAIYEASYEKSR